MCQSWWPCLGSVRAQSRLLSNQGVAIFTYALGSGADTTITKRLACENKGMLGGWWRDVWVRDGWAGLFGRKWDVLDSRAFPLEELQRALLRGGVYFRVLQIVGSF